MRMLVAALVVLAAAAAGYVAWLNGAPVTVRLGGEWAPEIPLAGALAAAFALGAALVSLIALVGAIRRSWHRMGERRRARRVARRANQTARARQLVWTGEPDRARATILRGDHGTPSGRDRVEVVLQTYLAEGDLGGAAELLGVALEQYPGDVRLLDLAATVAERRGDHERAIEAIERARREDPSSPRLARRLRDLFIHSARWREALALHEEIVSRLKSPHALGAEDEITRGLRFEVARTGDDAERSAKLLATLGREFPDFLPAWVEAGDRYLAAGKPAKARKVWERGARHRPATVLLARIEALDASEGASGRTTSLYRELVASHAEDAAVRRRFVRHLLASGAVDEAGHELESLDVSSGPSALLLGELLRRRGDHERAAATFARALGPGLGATSAVHCEACGTRTPAWAPACTACGRWGTIEAVDA